eukprot:COSAG01_NODE_16544_length_1227_cov_9.898050_2_plen_173_part_00
MSIVSCHLDAATGVQFQDALTITECQHLLTGNTFPIAADAASGSAPNVLPPLSKAYLQGSDLTGTTMFGFKPVTLEADFEKNRVRIQLGLGVSMTAAQQTASTLFSKVLGVTSAEALSTVDHPEDMQFVPAAEVRASAPEKLAKYIRQQKAFAAAKGGKATSDPVEQYVLDA